MPLFLWKKSYEVGAPEIDLQHRRLVGLINDMSDAMMLRQGHRAVPRVLEELVNYISVHFTAEEGLMWQSNYPNLEEHRREHLEMTTKVVELKKRYDQGHDLTPHLLLTFLCDWLKTHIIVNDKEFGNFLRSVRLEAKRQAQG